MTTNQLRDFSLCFLALSLAASSAYSDSTQGKCRSAYDLSTVQSLPSNGTRSNRESATSQSAKRSQERPLAVKKSAPKLQYTEKLISPEFAAIVKALSKADSVLAEAKAELAANKKLLKEGKKEEESEDSMSSDDGWSFFSMLMDTSSRSSAKRKPLSEAEAKEVTAKIEKLKSEVEKAEAAVLSLEKQYAARENVEIARVTKQLIETARANPIISGAINDRLNYESIKAVKGHKSLNLVAGRTIAIENYLKAEALPPMVRDLIREAIKDNRLVIHDGHSEYAKGIAELAGENSVAIFAESSRVSEFPSGRKLVIANDYLRMQALSTSDTVVVDNVSTVGLALSVESRANFIFGSSSNMSKLGEWQSAIKKNKRSLGVDMKLPQLITRAEQMDLQRGDREYKGYSYYASKPKVNDQDSNATKSKATPELEAVKISSLSFNELSRLYDEAVDYHNAITAENSTRSAVVFGSSSYDKMSAQLIYQTSYSMGQHGLTVFTGGSGGAMHIANAGAYNSGGKSIGVPIGGRATLATEKDAFTTVHTQTITTSDYVQRIPTLLGNTQTARNLVVFAPGGNGTIKELAVTLMLIANPSKTGVEKIVFLDSNYYNPLYSVLSSYGLARGYSSRIAIVDSQTSFASMLAQGGDVLQSLTPRSREMTFKLPKEEKKDDDKFGWGF